MKQFLMTLILLAGFILQANAQEPSITMKTKKAVGEKMKMYLKSFVAETSISIDFGDGIKQPFILDINGTNINGRIGETKQVTIYGDGIKWLSCREMSLFELDVTNCPSLEVLVCPNNNLKTLDLSKNILLSRLECESNELEDIDLSANTALTLLEIQKNKLKTLNLSNNKLLDRLVFSNNDIETIDLSANTALTYLVSHENKLKEINLTNNTALTHLALSDGIKEINLTNNTSLTYINIDSNQLTTLDVTKNTALTYLVVQGIQLTTLDVTKNTALTYLRVHGTPLTTLDVTKNTALTYLSVKHTDLTDIDLKNCTALKSVDLSYNELSSLDLSKCLSLEKIDCEHNHLNFNTLPLKQAHWKSYDYTPQANIDLKVKSIIEGEKVDLSSYVKDGDTPTTFVWGNRWSGDFIEGSDYTVEDGVYTFLKPQRYRSRCVLKNALFPDLTMVTSEIEIFSFIDETIKMTLTTTKRTGSTLYLYLGAEDSPKDVSVDFGDGIKNRFTISPSSQINVEVKDSKKINVYGADITKLDCDDEQVNSIDVSQNPYLKELDCAENQITSLDVSNNPALVELECQENKLEQLKLNAALTKVNCSQNKLTTLDISPCVALKEIDCQKNQLTKLKLNTATNVALQKLKCRYNQLTSLDVSNSKSLLEIDCVENKLTALLVNNCTALDMVYCSKNKLKTLDLSQTPALRRVYCSQNQFNFATLPAKQAYWEDYSYRWQERLPINASVSVGQVIDLSSQLMVGTTPTSYKWEINNGRDNYLTEGVDYTITNGITTFLKTQSYDVSCLMTNSEYPELQLRTTYMKVNTATAIEDHKNTAIKVYNQHQMVHITSEKPGKYQVYNLSGRLIKSGIISVGQSSFELPHKGICIVRAIVNGEVKCVKLNLP
jgi:Leucine-rich repeat (LRR) protein